MRSKLALGVRMAGVLGLLFFVTAAPGFGGHGGGFSGGGGFHGTGFRPTGSGGKGGGLSDQQAWLLLLGLFGGLGVWVFVAGRMATKLQQAHLVLSLNHGDRYVPLLDRLLATADAGSPAGRRAVVSELVAALRDEDVRSARLVTRSAATDVGVAGEAARRCHELSMRNAGLETASTDLQRGAELTGSCCALGVVAVVPASVQLPAVAAGNAVVALRTLGSVPGGPQALYVEYGPDPGLALSPEAADRMAEALAG
jgi:hypothetical protein